MLEAMQGGASTKLSRFNKLCLIVKRSPKRLRDTKAPHTDSLVSFLHYLCQVLPKPFNLLTRVCFVKRTAIDVKPDPAGCTANDTDFA